MNMRMKFELLAPGVQDTEEADLCPKVSRIARHFEEGFRTGTKQKIIEDLLVLQDQWRFRSMKTSPAARMISATSRGGRLIYFSPGGLSFSSSESKGLAVAFRWRCERCK